MLFRSPEIDFTQLDRMLTLRTLMDALPLFLTVQVCWLICHVAPFRSSVTLFARFGCFQRHRFCGASRRLCESIRSCSRWLRSSSKRQACCGTNARLGPHACKSAAIALLSSSVSSLVFGDRTPLRSRIPVRRDLRSDFNRTRPLFRPPKLTICSSSGSR